MSALRGFLLGTLLSITDPPQAVRELTKAQVLGGVYLFSAVATLLGGVAAVNLAFAAPTSDEVAGLSAQAIYRAGIGGAVLAGLLVPLVMPLAAAFLPWLVTEFSPHPTSYGVHIRILMVALTPAIVIGNTVSFVFQQFTGLAFDSSARTVLHASTHSMQLTLGYVDVFLIWCVVVAYIAYRSVLRMSPARALLLSILGGSCIALFHSVGLT
ncbi:MAG TPA: hypothetical protein VGK74_04670 [Symbiobacteriaceae bacterium]